MIIKNINARRLCKIDEEKCNGCGGIEYAVKQALQASGKFIPWRVVTISTDGKKISD